MVAYEVTPAAPRDMTLHSALGSSEPLRTGLQKCGLSSQRTAQIQVYLESGTPLFGLSWTFRQKELSLVLASTKDVHVYGEDVDVDLIVSFVVDYIVRDRVTFPLSAKPNFGHESSFDHIDQLDNWLKIHIRLMLQMNNLWSGRAEASHDGSSHVRSATDDELRQPSTITQGLSQITKFIYSDT